MQAEDARRVTNRKYYLANRAKVGALKRSNKQRNFAHVAALKRKPCGDCEGRFEPCVMDFDDVRGTKVRDISRMAAAGVSLALLDEEISKFDFVCSNCHRLRTWRRNNTPP